MILLFTVFFTVTATWTVVNEGSNQVRLHNNNNFLAIINGNTVVINMVNLFLDIVYEIGFDIIVV